MHCLGGQRETAITVARDQPARYAAEPVNQILPIKAPLMIRALLGAPPLAMFARICAFCS